MAESQIVQAIKYICEEKGLPLELVVETVESALAAAYRKDYGQGNQNIKVRFSLEDGSFTVYDEKEVVEDPPPPKTEEELAAEAAEREAAAEAESATDESDVVDAAKNDASEDGEDEEEEKKKRFNPKTQIGITAAKEEKKGAKIGDIIITDLPQPDDFGRMAAQTAKQVITQKLREAERNTIFEEFKSREGEVIIGNVQRREGRNILVDLGKGIALMPFDQQIPGERVEVGQRIKAIIHAVQMGQKGPEIILSRASGEFVRDLFIGEIPEISNDIIAIKSIAREAGSRTKIAVQALQDDIDPIGSCVGQRGTRVQTIISEINGEKIDIILFDEDPAVYITNALSPAKITKIDIDEENKSALVYVAEDQLSLAIGRAGQNVRLAAKLTGWKINIQGTESQASEDKEASLSELEAKTELTEESTTKEKPEAEASAEDSATEDKEDKKES